MVVILVFMFLGASISLYLEGQFKHQRLIDANNLIEQERYENRQMILQLMKRVQILEKKTK
jgi:hypothetical protein